VTDVEFSIPHLFNVFDGLVHFWKNKTVENNNTTPDMGGFYFIMALLLLQVSIRSEYWQSFWI